MQKFVIVKKMSDQTGCQDVAETAQVRMSGYLKKKRNVRIFEICLFDKIY